MSPDDPTLPDRIHLRTLVEWGLSPMLKREPMEILREMLGGQLPPEPVFVNLTAEQLARCIEAARRVMTPPPPAPPVNVVPVPVMEQRLAYTSVETARLLGVSKVTLWRLCKRGLIRPSLALRTSLFSRTEIERFLRDTKAGGS